MSSLVFLQMCKLRPRDDGLITFTFLRFALSGGFLRFSGILIVGQLLIITSMVYKDWCSSILPLASGPVFVFLRLHKYFR